MEIRIIPMSMQDPTFENKTIKQVQDEFFMDYLIKIGKGWYYYGKSGLEANTGDLLLFQMDNTVIASAELDDVIHFTKPTIDGSSGALILNRKIIKVFKPIIKEELSEIITGFTAFNQTKQKFNIAEVNMELLKQRMELSND